MAGDWIKMRLDLAEDPSVIGIAADLGLSEDEVVGKLHRMWSWASRQSRDGNAPSVTKPFLDRYVGVTGWCQAVAKNGWLEVSDHGIAFPHWERHLSNCAKERALASERASRYRHGASVTKSLPEKRREEKRDEEEHPTDVLVDALENGKEPPSKKPAVDVAENLSSWNALATQHGFPRAHDVAGSRLAALRARLREHPDLWSRVGAELAALGPWARSQRFWSLDWILKPANLAKLLEGNYRERPGESSPTAAARLGRQSSWRDPDKFKEVPGGL